MQKMKLLIVLPNVFPIPPQSYAGVEILAHHLIQGLYKKGHLLSVVCPIGSILPEGVEHIATNVNEPEEQSWHRYRERIDTQDFNCVIDWTWDGWSYISSEDHLPELPIMHTIHSVPQIYNVPPKVRFPCFVGISDNHVRDIRRHLKVDARRIYNGIDLNFYSPDFNVARNKRYLALGRYTAEKGMLTAMNMCQRVRVPLLTVGDTKIINDMGYLERCRMTADGVLVKYSEAVSREQTVALYRSMKALLFPLAWQEPFGLTVIEASACGMPVLTLKLGSMPELVKDGENGFAFENENELEEALRKDIAITINPNHARKVAEQFSIEKMVDEYEKMAAEVASGIRW